MTDSELLDRRIEQLVVSTVRRELRRDEEQKARIAQSIMPDGSQVATRPSDFLLHNAHATVSVLTEEQADAIARGTERNDLTTTVLIESLRRANLRAGEYARALRECNNECAEIRSKLEDMAKKLGQQKTQLGMYQSTCIRLTDERDLGRQRIQEMSDTCTRVIDERDKHAAQVVLLIKERDDARHELDETRAASDRWHAAYNELAKATA